MSNRLGTVADFVIKVLMMFTTILVLLFFAGMYPKFSLIFSFLALIMVLSIIVKGLVDIFSKE